MTQISSCPILLHGALPNLIFCNGYFSPDPLSLPFESNPPTILASPSASASPSSPPPPLPPPWPPPRLLLPRLRLLPAQPKATAKAPPAAPRPRPRLSLPRLRLFPAQATGTGTGTGTATASGAPPPAAPRPRPRPAGGPPPTAAAGAPARFARSTPFPRFSGCVDYILFCHGLVEIRAANCWGRSSSLGLGVREARLRLGAFTCAENEIGQGMCRPIGAMQQPNVSCGILQC